MNLVPPSSANTLDRARSQFHRDGFAVLREFVTGPDLDQLRSEIDRYTRDVAPGVPRTGVFYADKADPNRSDRRRWGFGLVYFAARARVDQAARQACREKLNAELLAERRI